MEITPTIKHHPEISPTKSSRRLMRQISGLGMEDPVFGGTTATAMMEETSFTSTTHMMMMFDDMGFDDLPKDMRDAVSVASDPTAAYSRAVQQHLLALDQEEERESICLNQLPQQDEEQDATTCTLTKDTLLAEAAQALEGRVSSSLLYTARHQLHKVPKHRATTVLRKPKSPAAAQPEQHRILPTIDSIFPL